MSRRSSRIRTPTEKGREYQLGLLYEERERSEARIRKTVKEMEVILSSSFSTELLTSKQAEIDNDFGKYLEVHSKRQVLLEDTIKRNLEEKSADELDREVFQLKKKILNAMSDRKSTGAVSRRSGSSAKGSSVSRSSKRSSHSSRKSMQSKVMEEETKLEELKIEAEFLQRQKEADLTAKQVQLQIEMEKSAAKLKIYKDYEEQIENLPDPPNCNDVSNDGYVREYVNLHRKSEPKVEVQNTKQIRRTVEEKSSVDQLASMLKHLQAPNIEIDYFSGDPLSFTYFLATFEEVVESKIDEQRGCLTRLLKYLRGEPKDLVSSCIYMASEVCYSEAKRILVERYGDPNRILGEYRKQLKAWPKVKPNDTAALRKFQTFAIKYRSASRFNTDMQCTDVVQLLHSKLPSYLQNSWNRKASKIRKKRAKEAQVDDFLHWLSDEVDVATDPLYSRDVSYETAQADLSRTKPHQRPSRSTVYQSSTSLTLKCPLCEEQHDLDDCLRFLRKPLEERRDFLFKTRLCFSCYNPSSKEHSARNCPNRRTCKECGGKHATGLHGYLRPRQSQDSRRKPFPKEEGPPKATPNDNFEVISSNTAHLSNPVISLCIVPVKIYGSNPAKCVETHALLDTGSQGTFIKEELLDQLEQDRTPTTIKLKTLHGETLESCSLVSGLSVSSVSDTSASVKLPITYSRKELPVDRDEVPTQHKIERFSYLRSIQDMLPSDDQQITLGILIGSNCPNALEPIKIIPSEEGGPYAFKTALGWCVSGPMSSSSSKVNCNRIFVRNITNGEVSNHHFRIQDEVKESSLSSMLMDLYNNDFSESPSCINSECDVSQEDLRFLKLMEDDVKVIDGHYQLPLPLRDKTFNFPNNKSQAHQRAGWLKRKLQSNKRMHGDYCKFMSNIFEKGYAVKAPINAPKGQTWYLPNFGVYHPRKPDKLRVVLDCSASYQGMSLNKQLLQGPDLTNQLIGVLSRFRMEQVAIIADIESMFYQVKVPESQHNLLRFLWWPNGNLQKSLEEYVMKVHIFGAISSPSCANFAIKKTAKDFESVYGKESANTLRRNFYVDDMLKAYPSNEVAINSFPKVVKMCKSGGFRLTKVVSNSRKVMQTINKEEVGKEFKELDLSKDLLPVERALGVHWSIENDCFGFRITLKDKPVTRRGILSTVSSIYDPLGFASPFLLQGKLILQQLCADQKGWDDELSSEQRMSWEKWRTNLPKLESIKVNRCIKPSGFGNVTKVSLNHFSDASEIAYGQVSYICVENTDGMISTTFLMGKSRVAPMKQTTIPRLELTAALVSARIGSQLKRELDLDKVEEHYWTDSEVVLGYLKNEGKRFHTFVANRVSNILSLTPRDQWCYVQSKDNPADDASRGLDINKYNNNQRWFTGPLFISQPIDTSTCTKEFNVSSDDKEVKVKISTNEVTVKEDFLSLLLLLLLLLFIYLKLVWENLQFS